MVLEIDANHVLIILNLELYRETTEYLGQIIQIHILVILGNADPEGQGYCQAGFSLDFYEVNSFGLAASNIYLNYLVF